MEKVGTIISLCALAHFCLSCDGRVARAQSFQVQCQIETTPLTHPVAANNNFGTRLHIGGGREWRD